MSPIARRFALKLSVAALAGALLPGGPARARRVFPRDGVHEYLVLHREEVVGSQRLGFSRASGHFTVRRDLAFELPGPAAQRLEHHSEEVWAGGWLSGLVSDTDDGGALWRVRAERDDLGVFKGVVNGLAFTVSGYPITSSLWHRDTPSQQALLDVVDARVKLIRAEDHGMERISVAGGELSARRFSIRGELRREVWYDGDCALVRVVLPARDGTAIALELR